MRYISTRGGAKSVEFLEALTEGLAPDGGLYTPETWPHFSPAKLAEFKKLPYDQLALEIFSPFAPDVPREELARIFRDAYKNFSAPDTAPLTRLFDNQYILELFHGPTLAFKDFAMQALGLLFDYALAKQNKKVTIVAATSGDTGSAAIEAFKNCKNVNLFVLHPYGRVSDVQRKQMTTVISPNIHNIALKGSFDDCQNIVKALFADDKFRADVSMSAVNSINWARIAAQIVYYFYAALKFETDVTFCVPTGNFGNILAGFIAKKTGLNIKNLIIASNSNDILTRFMQTGKMEQREVTPSLSPSMDIQISSNFERLLFEYAHRDADTVKKLMSDFKTGGEYEVKNEILQNMRGVFEAERADDDATLKTINFVFEKTGILTDPHTAVGLHAAFLHKGTEPVITLSTAHPAKFAPAVKEATGKEPALPENLKDLQSRAEKYDVLENSAAQIKEFIYGHLH